MAKAKSFSGFLQTMRSNRPRDRYAKLANLNHAEADSRVVPCNVREIIHDEIQTLVNSCDS